MSDRIFILGNLGNPSRVEYIYPCTPRRVGRHFVTFTINEREITRDVTIQWPNSDQSPRLMNTESPHGTIDLPPREPGHEVISDYVVNGAWRLAIDQQGESLYCTGNSSNSYSVVRLSGEGGNVERIVQCKDIIHVRGITVDADNAVYVTGDHKVQKYNTNGECVKQIGSAGGTQFNDPNGIRWHQVVSRSQTLYSDQGSIYVCDSGNARVVILTPDLDYIREESGILSHPEDIEFDSNNTMYVVDSIKHSIFAFNGSGHRTIQLEKARFPVSIHFINNKFFISDNSHYGIMIYDTNGSLVREVHMKPSESSGYLSVVSSQESDSFELSYRTSTIPEKPLGMEVGKDGLLYVCSWSSNKIYIYYPENIE